jgi:phage terminase large subunit
MPRTIEIVLPYQWSARAYQRPLWGYLNGGGKRAVTKWHRRSGKDEVFLHYTAISAHQRIGNYWYMLPEYSQARKSMWDAVNPHTGKRRIDDAFPAELRRSTKEQEMMIQFHCGSSFQLVGSDNFNSLVGSPPVGLVFSEYALSNPSAWAYLMPILEENGGWAGFNSTPRGKNHFKNLCEFAQREPGWFYESLGADQTGVFTDAQLESIRRQMQSTHGDAFGDALFKQEYYVSFDAAVPGSFWGDCLDKLQLMGRINNDCVVDQNFPVNTAWDLGRTDDTAIWFYQIIGGGIWIFDYHASTGKDIQFYADLLRDKAKSFGFTYGTHWLPHDARARTLAAGGKSIQQQMINQNVGRIVIAKKLDHQEGIQAARNTFPWCRFHEERCADGIEALKHYHREWDEDLQKFGDNPVHDWSSHGSSAFRTLSLSWKVPREASPDTPIVDTSLQRGYDFGKSTFGALKDAHLSRKRAQRQELF